VAVEFNGLLDEFAAVDVQVVGVTVEKPETNREWVARHGVKIPMIEDSDYAISNAFGVTLRMGGVKHATFLIDADGVLRKAYPKVRAKGHAAAVRGDCREIWG
jgi:peroxiredoxin Q/BCP